MSGTNPSSRQKMIGMMYLVLTALLALNVSKEILDAFVFINNGLQRTNTALEAKSMSSLFAITHSSEALKKVPFEEKATEVIGRCDEMLSFIEILKARTMDASVHGNRRGDGYAEFLNSAGKSIALDALDSEGKLRLKKPDEDQNCTSLLVGSDPAEPSDHEWSAHELKNRLESFRDYMKTVQVVDIMGKDHQPKQEFLAGLDSVFTYRKEYERDKLVEWETKHFYHVPVVASITYLTKLQTDVINAKADILNFLAEGITGKQKVFSDVSVAVVPRQSYVLRGDSFEAEVYLTAFDVANKTTLFVGDELKNGETAEAFDATAAHFKAESGTDGKARFRMSTGSLNLGDHRYSGMLEYTDNGESKRIPFLMPEFTVAEPSATISPTMMNVFYRGVDNPIDVSVPGADKSTIKLKCDGHTIVRKGDQWVVQPGAAATAVIKTYCTLNGEERYMGEQTFKVKKIPTPVAYLGGKGPYDGTIKEADLDVAKGLDIRMEGFDFQVKPIIKSYKLLYERAGMHDIVGQSAFFTQTQADWVRNMKIGETLYVEDITVELPDKRVVVLAGLKLRVVR